MSEILATFGNPWHGKLRPGQIELQPDTPVSSITLAGIPATVKAVDGNLGVTRYHKAPNLPSPTANAEISAAHGALTNDFILFSSLFRYSPLSTVSILGSDMEWLLFDGSAQRWRKMALGVSINNSIGKTFTAQSPEGTTVIQIYVNRKPVFGTIDRIQGEPGPTDPPMEFVGAQNIPLIYAYSPLHRPTPSGYNPSQVLWSIDPSPDGRKILLRLEARRWNGFASPYTGDSMFDVYDASQTWLFGVWEISFSDDGSTMQAAMPVWPDAPAPPPIPTPPNNAVPERLDYIDYKLTTLGGVTWQIFPSSEYPEYNAVRYTIPVSVAMAGVNPYAQFDTSIMLNAAYDKQGNIQLLHFRMYSENTYSAVLTFDAWLGTIFILKTDDPANHIPDHSFNTATIHINSWRDGTGPMIIYELYPQIKQMDNPVQTGGFTYIQKLEVAKGTEILKSWSGKFSGPLKWRWKTNNIVELYVGAESKLRVGPGVVDDSQVNIDGFAAYNPRTGQLLSSNTAIGWV